MPAATDTDTNPERTVQCFKCGGKGKIQAFSHIARGVCFQCAGNGTLVVRRYIELTRNGNITCWEFDELPAAKEAAANARASGEAVRLRWAA